MRSRQLNCAAGIKKMTEDTDNKEESLFEAPIMAEQERMVEAILFATAEPVK